MKCNIWKGTIVYVSTSILAFCSRGFMYYCVWLQRNLFRGCWYAPHHKPAAQPFQYLFLIESHGFSSPLLYVSLLQLFAGVHHPGGSDLASPHLEEKTYKKINTER